MVYGKGLRLFEMTVGHLFVPIETIETIEFSVLLSPFLCVSMLLCKYIIILECNIEFPIRLTGQMIIYKLIMQALHFSLYWFVKSVVSEFRLFLDVNKGEHKGCQTQFQQLGLLLGNIVGLMLA